MAQLQLCFLLDGTEQRGVHLTYMQYTVFFCALSRLLAKDLGCYRSRHFSLNMKSNTRSNLRLPLK